MYKKLDVNSNSIDTQELEQFFRYMIDGLDFLIHVGDLYYSIEIIYVLVDFIMKNKKDLGLSDISNRELTNIKGRLETLTNKWKNE